MDSTLIIFSLQRVISERLNGIGCANNSVFDVLDDYLKFEDNEAKSIFQEKYRSLNHCLPKIPFELRHKDRRS